MDDWKLKVHTVVKPRECYLPSLDGQLVATSVHVLELSATRKASHSNDKRRLSNNATHNNISTLISEHSIV